MIELGMAAARLIDDGLYCVDIKQNVDGVSVIEVNDTPNIAHSIEDQVMKNSVWSRLARWFFDRLDV